MSKFNSTIKLSSPKTENLAGGVAYAQDDKTALVSLMLTSFLENTFYESAEDAANRMLGMVNRVGSNDPLFVAKAAIYARNTFGMRSITHLVAAALAPHASGHSWGSSFYNKVVSRVDDATEIVAAYQSLHGKRDLTNAMKRGIGASLSSFDAYALGKYKSSKKDVSLVDVVNITHPKHTPQLQRLVNGSLESPKTWEVMLSECGSDPIAKAHVWKELLSERKIGYFALLRNLNNILTQADDETKELAIQMLTDRNAIKSSKVFPYRYLTAYKRLSNVSGSSAILKAIIEACDIALDNIPRLEGKSLVVVDSSASMNSPVGRRNIWSKSGVETTCGEVAALFGAAIAKTGQGDMAHFADTAEFINSASIVPSIISATSLPYNKLGWGTNLASVFEMALGVKYNRFIVISDMQSWVEPTMPALTRYASIMGQPHVYMLDLRGHGTRQTPDTGWLHEFAGYSDKLFDVMALLEQDRNAMVNEVDRVVI